MSIFFKAPLDIEIRLDNEDSRKHHEVKSPQGRLEKLPVYKDGESVKGTVTLRTKEGKKLDHLGVKVQLLGSIETNTDSIVSSEFLTLATELAAPSQLVHPESYPFEFKNVEKQYESYRGKNVRLRYFIKVSVMRKSSADITREKELWVFHYATPTTTTGASGSAAAAAVTSSSSSSAANPKANATNATTGDASETALAPSTTKPPQQEGRKTVANRLGNKNEPHSVKMDVGIEDCLHIEFEYSKSRFSLKDVIIGKIYFLLVRLKIKHMELSLIRRETVGAPPSQVTDSETVVRFEIMDGAPVRGETIPIRVFLAGFDLVPTYRDVNKKFSVRTYLLLVLIDEDARRYFKQSEIVLFREG
ncbi:Carboxypeptidase Y-deficient protein 8 [Candida viswanathii]|uniref:Carboxypeptidase Y-deficient protein 8 n=1 Tax=Candida viswanathii TaxID=5486 RepID=A0A367XVD1_9ASCO|nr:Carboxypeptidase Y-deficient protein 8 [Candida viswanathii]